VKRLGKAKVAERYGTLFDMYQRITDENPYEVPMRIYPAVHYAMGGLWVDYNLMSNIPGLHVLGEANFSDHGANRLGASALMQDLADGYFVIPYTIGQYLATSGQKKVTGDEPEFKQAAAETKARIDKLLSIGGKRSPTSFHKELGLLMWDNCGMARNREGLLHNLERIPQIREEFWNNLNVLGDGDSYNMALEKAGRVADYLEFAELLCRDALHREESCGGHFREEFQSEAGEAERDDEKFTYVAAWNYTGELAAPELIKEPLIFEEVHPTTRSYK
ncbi:MAG: FAD-binding protein, partial [Deltaproteobacteria bacterium]|nr:FAD-binding protein [Deltaproteobacteria bacterium]